MVRDFNIGDTVKIANDDAIVSDGIILDVKGFGLFKQYAVEYRCKYPYDKEERLCLGWFYSGQLVRCIAIA